MKHNDDSIILHQEAIRDMCYSCRNLESNNWYTAPHINVNYYSCKCGGCKELAKCYNEEEFLSSFQNEIIKKFL